MSLTLVTISYSGIIVMIINSILYLIFFIRRLVSVGVRLLGMIFCYQNSLFCYQVLLCRMGMLDYFLNC